VNGIVWLRDTSECFLKSLNLIQQDSPRTAPKS
jgi:hypothetical protein